MRTFTLILMAAVVLTGCGADELALDNYASDSAQLAGVEGPSPIAPVGDLIHEDQTTFACEPAVLHLDKLVTRVSLHTSIPRSLVDADTVVVFGNTDEPIAPLLITSDALGNMIVRVAADDLARVVAVPGTALALEGARVDGSVFGAVGLLQVMD